MIKILTNNGYPNKTLENDDEFKNINLERLLKINPHIKLDSEQDENDFIKNNIKVTNFSIQTMDKKDITNEFNIISFADLINLFNIEDLISKYKSDHMSIYYKLIIKRKD